MGFDRRFVYTTHAAFAADGSSAAVALPAAVCAINVYHGTGVTFGSGTLKIQVSPDGGTTWLDVPSASWTTATANTKKARYLVIGGTHYRVTLTGSTSPTLNVETKVVPLADAKVTRIVCEDITDNKTNGVFQPYVQNAGIMAIQVYGTFDSGTVSVHTSPDNGTTKRLLGAAISANGYNHYQNSEDEDGIFLTVASIASTAASFKIDLYQPIDLTVDLLTHFDNVDP